MSSAVEGHLAERVRAVHRSYATGVAVVTTRAHDVPFGLAVNAFSSVSLNPPTVLVCVATSARTHEHLYHGEHIGVNLLAHDQREVAVVFAKSGGDKFASIDWASGGSGVPVLAGVAAWLELAIEQRLAAGTHTIFIGRVIAAEASDRPPLLYKAGNFFDGAQLAPVAAA